MNLHRTIWISELHEVRTVRSGACPGTLEGTVPLISLHGLEIYFSGIFINVKFYITGIKNIITFFPNLIYFPSQLLPGPESVSQYLFSESVLTSGTVATLTVKKKYVVCALAQLCSYTKQLLELSPHLQASFGVYHVWISVKEIDSCKSMKSIS